MAKSARPSTFRLGSGGATSGRRSTRSESKLLEEVYRRLLERYGPQHWWPGENAFEVCIGAILTQSATWGNAEKALTRLKNAGVFSPWRLYRLPEAAVAELIRPSGYFNAKARKVKAFVAHLCQRYNGELGAMLAQPMEALREELLSLHGIGEETADDIVLYAAEQPSFVIDAYTRRIADRLGVGPGAAKEVAAAQQQKGARPSTFRPRSGGASSGPAVSGTYAAYQAQFIEALPPDTALYNEYHALLVRLGKEVCLKRDPRCGACPLGEVCATGRGEKGL